MFRNTRKNLMIFGLPLLILILANAAVTIGQTTAFTYQGKLTDASNPANGNYEMQFRLFENPNAGQGTQAIATFTVPNVTAINGIFTAQLDFGAVVFAAGADLYLEISVRPAGSTGVFTSLAPRQRLTSAPYSVRALSAANADNAASATTAVNAQNLGGAPANQFAQTNTTAFIRNQTALQTTANFNISGTGEANIFNAAAQYNIGGARVLSNAGSNNLFAGIGAGNVNTGIFNSFFGGIAGSNNTTGSRNSFFGSNAGSNTLSGSNNSFVGTNAGTVNITGGNNTLIGSNANLNVNNLNFASAIGSNALVTASDTIVLGKFAGNYTINNVTSLRPADAVVIPGNLTVNGAFSGDINAANIISGTLDNAVLGIVPIAKGGTGSATQNFVDLTTTQTVAGDKTFISAVNTSLDYRINGARVLSVAGSDNLFAGVEAGGAANTGFGNSFFGAFVGNKNTGGDNNSFVGVFAGNNNTTGSSNSFFGSGAGLNNKEGSNNTIIGSNASVGSSNLLSILNYASAIGSNARVSTSDTIVLGKVAGTYRVNGTISSRPADAVVIPGDLTVNGGSINTATQYNIGGSRVLSNAGSNNLFAGINTGNVNTGINNLFVGAFAGQNNAVGGSNSFVGRSAGESNTDGGENSFFGRSAGSTNGAGSQNSFFGRSAGSINATGDNNTIIGALANVGSDALNFATALGSGAVVSTSNTVVLGRAADTVQIPGNFDGSNIKSGTIAESRLGVAGMGFMGRGTFGGAGTQFFSPNGNSTQSSVIDNVEMLTPNRACTAQNLSVQTTGTLSLGATWTFALLVNDISTPISCTVSSSSASCNSGAATFLIPAGQRISIRSNKGGSTTQNFQFGWECR